MKIKVCGVPPATAERDIDLLAGSGIDAVGLWHGVPGTQADLSLAELEWAAGLAHARDVEPVIVTFTSNAAALARAADESGAKWVQLHAYQLPKVVRDLKASVRRVDVRVVKVLHIRDRRCPDLRLVDAYERAGVDGFLLDVATRDGRVGSTGEAIPADVAASVVVHLRRPFYLAGGLSERGTEPYEGIRRDAGFGGIDVSTAARDAAGRLRTERIDAIEEAWRRVRVR
jgi:phosphoribosylanthranilate isomerase